MKREVYEDVKTIGAGMILFFSSEYLINFDAGIIINLAAGVICAASLVMMISGMKRSDALGKRSVTAAVLASLALVSAILLIGAIVFTERSGNIYSAYAAVAADALTIIFELTAICLIIDALKDKMDGSGRDKAASRIGALKTALIIVTILAFAGKMITAMIPDNSQIVYPAFMVATAAAALIVNIMTATRFIRLDNERQESE